MSKDTRHKGGMLTVNEVRSFDAVSLTEDGGNT